MQAEVVNANSGLFGLAGIDLKTDLKLVEDTNHNGYKNAAGKVRGWGSTKISLTFTLTGKLPKGLAEVNVGSVNISPDYTFVVVPGSSASGDFPKLGGLVPILSNGKIRVLDLFTGNTNDPGPNYPVLQDAPTQNMNK